MAKIPGGLVVDMFPDGTVRLVFLADSGGGNESPVIAKDLDAAEALFMMCGLTADRAAALSGTVKRNKIASVETSVDEDVAAKFRNTVPSS